MDGITYKTTDVLKWGTGGGSGIGGNLTPTELDLNFWELYSRLKDLEDNPPVAVSITGMTLIGRLWQVNMSNGSHFGPFTLPIATFEFKGDWVNAMHYYELDLVSVPGYGLFLVRIGHDTPILPAVFDPLADDGLGNLLYLKVFGEDTYIYDVGWFYPGRPGNGIETDGAMAGHAFVRAVTLPISLTGSVAKLKTATTGALSFPLYKNLTLIGSVDFAAAATVGTFTFAADVLFAVGDVVRLIRPTAIDAAARELSVTLFGIKSQ